MPVTIQSDLRIDRGGRGRKELCANRQEPAPLPPGRVPRVSRLMALALRFDGMVRAGEVQSYVELAELGHVSRARMSQIMKLLHLAPHIQEELLFLQRPQRGRDPILLWQLQPVAALFDWRKQWRRWRALNARACNDSKPEGVEHARP